MTTTTRKRDDSWALVTGAGQRLGREIADRLAADGYAVAVHYHRSADAAMQLTRHILKRGDRAVAVKADLAAPDQLDNLLARAADALGAAAANAAQVCLINCAAQFEHDDISGQTDAWDLHMAVNLRAPHRLTEALLAYVKHNDAAGRGPNNGVVVNILDRTVVDPPAEFVSYNISKAALASATRIAAKAGAPLVRVNAVAPGPTICHPRQSATHFEAQGQSVPMARNPDPAEVVDAVMFLLANRSIVGQVLQIDGGWHLL